jgi:hypothetical protein
MKFSELKATNSMKQSHFWEADNHSDGQEIIHLSIFYGT